MGLGATISTVQFINELYPHKVPAPPGGGAGISWLEGVDPARQRSGAADSAGFTAVAETSSRIHIPAGPWPGTAQKIRKEPALAATNRTSPPCPAEKPWSARAVAACSNAGGTGPAGTGFVSAMTAAEWGRFWSWFLKCSTTLHPFGTVTTRPPLPKPLKFIPPLRSVRPATNRN